MKREGESELKPEEEKQEPERTSGLMRVAGVSPEKEEEILKVVKMEYFDIQELDKKEREKTPEELEIINRILNVMPSFVRKYGGIPVPITPEHIHVIDPDKLSKKERENPNYNHRSGSNYQRHGEWIFILPQMNDKNDLNKLAFALGVAHEVLHFNAFQSDNPEPLNEIGATTSTRRQGVSVGSKDGNGYFKGLDEAITEVLTIRFDKEYFKSIPVLAGELEERDEARAAFAAELAKKSLRDRSGNISYLAQIGEGSKTRIGKMTYTYFPERVILSRTITKTLQENPERFKRRGEVFNVFAKAYFTGKILDIARLIEKTYGKGYFRELGEKTERIRDDNIRKSKVKNKNLGKIK